MDRACRAMNDKRDISDVINWQTWNTCTTEIWGTSMIRMLSCEFFNLRNDNNMRDCQCLQKRLEFSCSTSGSDDGWIRTCFIDKVLVKTFEKHTIHRNYNFIIESLASTNCE